MTEGVVCNPEGHLETARRHHDVELLYNPETSVMKADYLVSWPPPATHPPSPPRRHAPPIPPDQHGADQAHQARREEGPPVIHPLPPENLFIGAELPQELTRQQFRARRPQLIWGLQTFEMSAMSQTLQP